LNAEVIQKQIDDFYYWDARVLNLSCNYFGDEVILVYEDKEEGDVQYLFTECYNVLFQHNLNEKKISPVNLLKANQMPYFLQDVEIKIISHNNNNLYKCSIDIAYMTLEILCKNINISRVKNET